MLSKVPYCFFRLQQSRFVTGRRDVGLKGALGKVMALHRNELISSAIAARSTGPTSIVAAFAPAIGGACPYYSIGNWCLFRLL